MTHIKIKISKAAATAEKDGIITTGMVGVPVSFMFDSWWDGLIVTAVFKGSGAPISVPLLGATDTVVPWEVLKRPSTLLRIGAEGRLPDGTLVIPTTWATVGIVMSGANATDDLAKPPTPTAFDRIMSQIGNMNDLTTEAKDTLVAAINEAARTGGGGGSMDLRVADGYVQYSSDGGMTWTNLIAIADLKGDPGEPGNDGHSPVVTATKSGKTTTISVDGAAIATVEDGADGKSAYQYAQDGGYTGTETEFAAKLAEEMPDRLPNPNAITFTGAVTGSYDGSAPVNVEIPSGGGSGGSEWQTILTGETTVEAVTTVTIPMTASDFDEYRAVIVVGKNTDGTTTNNNTNIWIDGYRCAYYMLAINYGNYDGTFSISVEPIPETRILSNNGSYTSCAKKSNVDWWMNYPYAGGSNGTKAIFCENTSPTGVLQIKFGTAYSGTIIHEVMAR